MAARRNGDLRIGLMITGYEAILASVPTELERVRQNAPLTPDELDRASRWMDETKAQIAAEREQCAD